MRPAGNLILTKQQVEDFRVYTEDHHLVTDTIGTMHDDEMREALQLLAKNWPTAVAHSLAIMLPNTEIQFQTVEHRQDLLKEAGLEHLPGV